MWVWVQAQGLQYNIRCNPLPGAAEGAEVRRAECGGPSCRGCKEGAKGAEAAEAAEGREGPVGGLPSPASRCLPWLPYFPVAALLPMGMAAPSPPPALLGHASSFPPAAQHQARCVV